MKIRKTAEQKNVTLNTEYYTQFQINEMLQLREICYFNENLKQTYEPLKSWDINETELRIFTEDLEEIKVVLDEYGHYTTVAVGKNGITYYVNL